MPLYKKPYEEESKIDTKPGAYGIFQSENDIYPLPSF
jgi:hypothetical protein